MDGKITHMEKTIRTYGLLPRRFPGELLLEKAGFIKGKDYRISRILPGVNFSFLLKGSGNYFYGGCEYRLEAPCVFMQVPQVFHDYGPDEGAWDELFITYRDSDLKPLLHRNFCVEGQLFWSIGGNFLIWGLLKEMKEMLLLPPEQVEVDRMDRLAERIILESHLSRRDIPPTREELLVRQVCAELSDLSKDPTLDELASRHGVSLQTLRRYWSSCMKVPLAQFRSRLVMDEAAKLLVETGDPIHAIARKLKFRDALYFSRKFSKESGMSPLAFRERFSHSSRQGPSSSEVGSLNIIS